MLESITMRVALLSGKEFSLLLFCLHYERQILRVVVKWFGRWQAKPRVKLHFNEKQRKFVRSRFSGPGPPARVMRDCVFRCCHKRLTIQFDGSGKRAGNAALKVISRMVNRPLKNWGVTSFACPTPGAWSRPEREKINKFLPSKEFTPRSFLHAKLRHTLVTFGNSPRCAFSFLRSEVICIRIGDWIGFISLDENCMCELAQERDGLGSFTFLDSFNVCILWHAGW